MQCFNDQRIIFIRNTTVHIYGNRRDLFASNPLKINVCKLFVSSLRNLAFSLTQCYNIVQE